MSPLTRLFSYVRRVPERYIAGAVLTIGYAIVFPLIPLAMRELIGRIELGFDEARALGAAAGGLSRLAVFEAALVLIAMGVLAASLRFASRFALFQAGKDLYPVTTFDA